MARRRKADEPEAAALPGEMFTPDGVDAGEQDEQDERESYESQGYEPDPDPVEPPSRRFIGHAPSFTQGPSHSDAVREALPVWQDARRYGATCKMRVQRRSVDGDVFDLGFVAYDASEEAILSRFGQPGTYLLMPVNEHGRQMLVEPIVKRFGPDHVWFKQQENGAGGGRNAPAAAQGLDPGVLALLKQQNEILREELLTARREMVEMRNEYRDKELRLEQRLSDSLRELNATKTQILQENTQSLNANFDFILQRNAQLHQMTAEQQSKMVEREIARISDVERSKELFVKGMLEAQAQQQALVLKAMQAEQDRARLEAERERERIRELAADRERMWQEQRRLEREASEREEQRRQEHTQLVLAQATGQTLVEQLENTRQLAGALGMSEKEDDSLMGIVKEGIRAFGPIMASRFMPVDDDDDDGDEGVLPAQVYQQQLQAQLPQAPAAQIPMGAAPPPPVRLSGGDPAQQAPGQGQAQGQSPAPAQVVNPVHPSGLAPKALKKARAAILETVQKLAQAPRDEWITLIAMMITSVPETGNYLAATTIQNAVAETGAPTDLVEAICTACAESDLVKASGLQVR